MAPSSSSPASLAISMHDFRDMSAPLRNASVRSFPSLSIILLPIFSAGGLGEGSLPALFPAGTRRGGFRETGRAGRFALGAAFFAARRTRSAAVAGFTAFPRRVGAVEVAARSAAELRAARAFHGDFFRVVGGPVRIEIKRGKRAQVDFRVFGIGRFVRVVHRKNV